MIRISITDAAFEAIAATLLAAVLLAGAVKVCRAETIHGALAKAYGTHDLDRARQHSRRHARPRPKATAN
jgi:hypothetical protein